MVALGTLPARRRLTQLGGQATIGDPAQLEGLGGEFTIAQSPQQQFESDWANAMAEYRKRVFNAQNIPPIIANALYGGKTDFSKEAEAQAQQELIAPLQAGAAATFPGYAQMQAHQLVAQTAANRLAEQESREKRLTGAQAKREAQQLITNANAAAHLKLAQDSALKKDIDALGQNPNAQQMRAFNAIHGEGKAESLFPKKTYGFMSRLFGSGTQPTPEELSQQPTFDDAPFRTAIDVGALRESISQAPEDKSKRVQGRKYMTPNGQVHTWNGVSWD
jgi:hypothetical protein